MHLVYRPADMEDVDACARLVPPALYALAPDLRTLLPPTWRRWLRENTGHLTVIEDAERPPETRLVAFGSSVFVSSAFAAQARIGLPPPILAHLARGPQKAASPVLSSEAVRAANGGAGLCILVPIIGWDKTALNDDEVRRVKARLIEAFFYRHAGYRIKEFLQEVYSQQEMERGRVIGMSLRTDYAPFFPPPAPPPATHPYLVGVTKDECRDGSMVSPLFLYAPPRFAFRAGEQDVLCLALLDQSDDEIAVSLHVSPGTVHKRWQAIHERVSHHAPDWFPAEGSAPADTPRTRGAEKRRRLLSYLRHHPEELRPHPLGRS